MSRISTASFNDIGSPMAIGSRRVPNMPLGGKHWLTSTAALAAWNTWGVSQTRFQSDPTNGLLVSEVLPQGCNVALSFGIGHGSDAIGKTANVRIWIVEHWGTGINGPNESIELTAKPLLDLLVTGGAYVIPSESQIPPAGIAGSRVFADAISVISSFTLDGTARVIGAAPGGIASVVVDGAGGSQLLIDAQVNGGGATATGVGIFGRTL